MNYEKKTRIFFNLYFLGQKQIGVFLYSQVQL